MRRLAGAFVGDLSRRSRGGDVFRTVFSSVQAVGHYRREKLARRIRDFLSEAISLHLNDPRVAPLTTITRVEVSADYVYAKVFISPHGGEGEAKLTLAGLRHARGHLQRLLASDLQMRQCPKVSFELDRGQMLARETLRLIDANRAEREKHSEEIPSDLDSDPLETPQD